MSRKSLRAIFALQQGKVIIVRAAIGRADGLGALAREGRGGRAGELLKSPKAQEYYEQPRGKGLLNRRLMAEVQDKPLTR